jgi:NADPH-dependent curcumin reductase CurA
MLAHTITQGKVAVRETFFDGEEAYGQGTERLVTGGNYGKVVVTTGRSKL